MEAPPDWIPLSSFVPPEELEVVDSGVKIQAFVKDRTNNYQGFVIITAVLINTVVYQRPDGSKYVILKHHIWVNPSQVPLYHPKGRRADENRSRDRSRRPKV